MSKYSAMQGSPLLLEHNSHFVPTDLPEAPWHLGSAMPNQHHWRLMTSETTCLDLHTAVGSSQGSSKEGFAVHN